MTVREALGALRQDNLIRTRRGRGGGSFVCTPADGGQQALVARLGRMGLGELRDLADHYAAICSMSAQLAALRADAEDVRRLRELGAAAAEGLTGTARWRAEGNFHLELAAAAQSARLTREEMALQSEVGMLRGTHTPRRSRMGSRPTGIRSWWTASRRATPRGSALR